MFNKHLSLAARIYPYDKPEPAFMPEGTLFRMKSEARGHMPLDMAAAIRETGWDGNGTAIVIERIGNLIKSSWNANHFDILVDFVEEVHPAT